jgi:hypothetical protein
MKLDMLPPPTPIQIPEEIRVLTEAEIKSVEHIFLANGNHLPDPSVSTFIGTVKDGEVIAFIVVQLKLHAEPMWIKDGHSELFKSLASAAERFILQRCGPQYVYVFTPAGRISQLAQAMGMQMEPYIIHSKLVMPEAPAKPSIDFPLPVEPSSEEVIQ